MAEIHGVYPDGQLIKGIGVFRETYKAVGLGWLMAPNRLVAGEKSCDCGK